MVSTDQIKGKSNSSRQADSVRSEGSFSSNQVLELRKVAYSWFPLLRAVRKIMCEDMIWYFHGRTLDASNMSEHICCIIDSLLYHLTSP